MAARADIVVIKHVAKASIDQRRPRGRCLRAEAEQRAVGVAAEFADVIGEYLRLGGDSAGADCHAQRVEHALLEHGNKCGRQRIKAKSCRMLRERARCAVVVVGLLHRGVRALR